MIIKKPAFTLIEIVFAIGILAGIIFGTLALFGAIISARAKTQAEFEVISNARIALAIMDQRVRGALSINAASSTFLIHPGVLSLQTNSTSTNPTVFSLSGNRLQIVEDSFSALMLTSAHTDISNLVFTPVSYPGSPGGIQIDMTMQYRNPDSDPNYAFSQNYQTIVMLRP